MSETAKIVTFILPALNAGGAERVLITLMNNIDRRKFIPVFISMQGEGTLSDLIDPSIQSYMLNTSAKLGFFKLKKTLDDIKPDIVVSTMTHMNFCTLSLRKYFPQTKFIVREAITPSYLFKKYGPLSFFIKKLYSSLYPKANVILSPAQIAIDELKNIKSLSDKKFRVLRNPFDLEKLNSVKTFPALTPDRNRTLHFVAAGRLNTQKGFDRLIEALAIANLSYDWVLNIYGEGEEREALNNLIKEKKLKGKVFLKGLVKEPYAAFGSADAFLLPSRFEGLPNVAIESLACGTPVIAHKEAGGIHEIEQEAGSAVTIAKNMDDFTAALKNIKPNPVDTFRASLLPDTYKQQTIIKKFEEILSEV